MNRLWIGVGIAAVCVWAYSPTRALAQCCGGGGSHGGHSTNEKDPPKDHEADTKAPAEVKLPTCPVTGKPIDFSFSTMTKEGPVYFASKDAIKKFNEDPKAYEAKVEKQRAALAKMDRIQVTCPVSGDPIDGKNSITVDGKKIEFCSAKCSEKYVARPEEYKTNLAGAYTYQTHCPVMGGEINPTVFTDLPGGQRVYLCCKGCDKKIQSEPEKYAAALAKQGIHIDAAKPKADQKKSGDDKPAKGKPEKKDADHGEHQHGGGRP